MKRNLLVKILTVFSMLIFQLKSADFVYILKNNCEHYQTVVNALESANINFKQIDSISSDENIHIIFDLYNIDSKSLPKNYIAYQTQDLSHYSLNDDYLDKLNGAIAVWDYSFDNIARYPAPLKHYYYFPANYEYIDPVLLVCRVPIAALPVYKQILAYSNVKNTDISSHLPTIFAHGVLQKPLIVVEAGVRGGESTIPLKEVCTFCNATLIGIDIDQMSAHVYASLNNAYFVCMDDLQFPQYFKNNFGNQKIDVIFIDTSHLYKHTLDEIRTFVPLLSESGSLIFHDSNVTPINGVSWQSINNVVGYAGPGNTRGVTQALKEYLGLEFDEYRYLNFEHEKNSIRWQIIHYPYCNGLTILKKQS